MLKNLAICTLLCLTFFCGFSQDFNSRKMADSIETVTMVRKLELRERWLFKGWYYSPHDSSVFSRPGYNHSHWQDARSTLNYFEIGFLNFRGFGWFRYRLVIDSAERHQPHLIYVRHKGAMVLFVNGKLYLKQGVVAKTQEEEERASDSKYPVILPYNEDGVYLIAVRYSNQQYEHSYNASGMQRAGFDVFLCEADPFIRADIQDILYRANFSLPLFGFFITVSILHFLLYVFYRERRSNLYFSLFTLILSFYFFCLYAAENVISSISLNEYIYLAAVMLLPLMLVSMQSVLYSMFYSAFSKFFRILFVCSLATSFSYFISNIIGFLFTMLIMITVIVDAIRIIIKINRERHKGAMLITSGYAVFILFFILSFFKGLYTGNVHLGGGGTADNFLLFVFMAGILSIPLSMSVYLARDFATTNRVLSHKLKENEMLSEKAIQQEQEKQRILSMQKEMLEIQVKERTREIEDQKKVIEEKNKDITDSINYAQRIQRSILPSESEIKEIFGETFVLFKPRDIVSGDFYQFKRKDDYYFVIMADCTGHGVPGALMSMIGSNLLHQIIIERGILMPQLILKELHREVKRTLRQTKELSSHDGMDISIAVMHQEKLYVASANRPVYLIYQNELTEIKPTKKSIGGSSTENDTDFELNEYPLIKSQMLYMFSDGYADQFGGEAGKKFKVKNLAGLLMEVHREPLDRQYLVLSEAFESWKGSLEQVDDVTLIGIRF